jgi:predicted Rossmann-fold nucleotide-binding protein
MVFGYSHKFAQVEGGVGTQDELFVLTHRNA